jgi:hypothetical protein
MERNEILLKVAFNAITLPPSPEKNLPRQAS